MAAFRNIVASVFCGSLILAACGSPNSADDTQVSNRLAVGQEAKTKDAVSVPTRWADDYNYRSKAEILGMRARYVQEVPSLLSGQYQPSEPIFSRIEDKKPWWGLAGRSVYGPGGRSMEGLAEESRFMSNPYLLVGADPASASVFDPAKITNEDLADPNFPYAWHLKSLTWWPSKLEADATYLATEFNGHMFEFKDKLKLQTIVPAFNLAAYNARDFGYNYIWLDEKHSTNIINVNHPRPEAVQITQMFHCGGTCGFAGGCNNMSPRMPAIDCIKYTNIPAKAVVRLWRQKPTSVDEPADFTFNITLE